MSTIAVNGLLSRAGTRTGCRGISYEARDGDVAPRRRLPFARKGFSAESQRYGECVVEPTC